MPKFLSKCGYEFNLSKIPNDNEYKLIPEFLVDHFAEMLDGSGLDTGYFYEKVDSLSATVLLCPKCKRIYVDNGKGVFQSYLMES